MKRKEPVETSPENYRHVQTYRVRYGDLDTYRHVNNKAFLTFVEDARVHYLIDAAGFTHHQDEREGVMVVHASIDYMAQIHPFEHVRVYTRTALIGEKSITLHHLIMAGPQEPRVAAVSVTVLASVDLKTNSSRTNSPAMINAITTFEKLPPETKPLQDSAEDPGRSSEQ